MFSDYGKKVMQLASVLAAIVIILSVLGGLALMVAAKKILAGIFVIIIGLALAYLGNIMMYAFGELVYNTSQILRNLQSPTTTEHSQDRVIHPGEKMYPNAAPTTKPVSAPSTAQDTITCPFCKKALPKGTVFCGSCGAQIGSK